MPKSRHRKNQKKKSKARSEKMKAEKIAFKKKMQDDFENKLEELRNRELEIEEVDTSKTKDDVSFEEIKS